MNPDESLIPYKFQESNPNQFKNGNWDDEEEKGVKEKEGSLVFLRQTAETCSAQTELDMKKMGLTVLPFHKLRTINGYYFIDPLQCLQL